MPKEDLVGLCQGGYEKRMLIWRMSVKDQLANQGLLGKCLLKLHVWCVQCIRAYIDLQFTYLACVQAM